MQQYLAQNGQFKAASVTDSVKYDFKLKDLYCFKSLLRKYSPIICKKWVNSKYIFSNYLKQYNLISFISHFGLLATGEWRRLNGNFSVSHRRLMWHSKYKVRQVNNLQLKNNDKFLNLYPKLRQIESHSLYVAISG